MNIDSEIGFILFWMGGLIIFINTPYSNFIGVLLMIIGYDLMSE